MNERENENQDRKYFVYREAASSEELEALLRLRYRIYSGCNLAKFVHENELGFEIDAYDFRSCHFGLFLVEQGIETPIGYVRAVEDRDVQQQPHLTNLMNKYADCIGGVSLQVSAPFPVMTYSPESTLLRRRYLQMRSAGESAVEGTRLALIESVRSSRMAPYIIECSIAIYFFVLGIDNVFACVDASKKAFYRLYGWNPIAGTSESDFAGLGESSVCLHGSAAGTPENVRPRILAMAEAFRNTGRICYFPDNPNVFSENEAESIKISAKMSQKAVA